MDLAFDYSRSHSICAEVDYKYHAMTETCIHQTGCSEGLPRGCQEGRGYEMMVNSNQAELMAAVAQQPVSIAISASSLLFQLYSGGIYDISCGHNGLEHAVLIVGYG